VYDTAENGIDHSENRLDAVSMKTGKKNKTFAKRHILSKQYQNFILPNLKEAIFKKIRISLFCFTISSEKSMFKYYKLNPKVNKTNKIIKERTIWDKFWQFVVKHFITAYFKSFIMNYSQFLPHFVFLILSQVLVI